MEFDTIRDVLGRLKLGQLTWQEFAPRISQPARGVLEQVLETNSSSRLTRDDCLLLADSEGEDLIALCLAADRLRHQIVGDVVTYVVNRNINFTNICFVGCKFCAFGQGPREAGSYFLLWSR